MRGGLETLNQYGVTLIGGHSVDNQQIMVWLLSYRRSRSAEDRHQTPGARLAT